MLLRSRRRWTWVVLALVAGCGLRGIELDGRPCPCIEGYSCIDGGVGLGMVCRRGGPSAVVGDGDDVGGDGDGVPAGDGDFPTGDGDAPAGDGDLPAGDGDLPAGDGDGGGGGAPAPLPDGGVAPPPCDVRACPVCNIVISQIACCKADGSCGCSFGAGAVQCM